MKPRTYRPSTTTDHPLSLYLHIPFCDHRCAYCDFNAYAGLDGLMPAYTDALVREIEIWGEALGSLAVVTVFFGGGTPSLLPLPLLERVTDAVRSRFRVEPDAEWSLEANPGTVDAAYFRGLRALGVNRLSIGVQSFDDEELRRLDRIHNAATAEAAFTAARAAGFDNVSLDLIFGLEGQTLAGWERNVRRALALAPEHLSLYALTIEEGTPLAHRVAKGLAPDPDPDLQADMYESACDLLAGAGYQHYEISNWARPGRACRHNLVYWRDGDWLGLGAGAHSHIGRFRFAVMNSPAGYIRRVRDLPPLPPSLKGRGSGSVRDRIAAARIGRDTSARGDDTVHGAYPPPDPAFPLPFREGGQGVRSLDAKGQGVRSGGTEGRGGRIADGAGHGARQLDEMVGGVRPFPWLSFVEESEPATAMADAAILALRLTEGLSLSAFEQRFDVVFDTAYGERLADVAAAGLLERDGDRVRLTARGRLLSNEVFSRIMGAVTG